MKNKTLNLAMILLKNGSGLGFKGSSTATKVMMIVLFAIAIPSMMGGVGAFTMFLMEPLMVIGQQGLVLTWGIGITSAAIFVFGIFYIISTFYFSSDVEYLLPLPLKPRQIVGAKFLVVTVFEYIFAAMIFIPIWITYGIRISMGPLYYLYGLVLLILMPIVPLALASLLSMIIMRFTNLNRYKDAFKIIGGLFAMFLGLGINMMMQSMSMNLSPEKLSELLQQGQNSLIGALPSIFPTAGWAGQALVHSGSLKGLMYFAVCIGFSAAVFAGLLALGQLIYLKGVVGLSETGSRRRGHGLEEIDKGVEKGSVITTYTLVELKLLFRTPIYFLNCVIINFLWPVFLLFPFLVRNEEVDMLAEISKAINQSDAGGIILAVFFALALFVSGSNGIAASAISREGQELYVKKYLPVSYKDQLIAKLLSALTLSYVAIVTMVIVGIVLFKIPVTTGVLVLLTGWLPVLFMCLSGLLIDLYNPKLDWDNEQKAVKQNINVLYSIIIGMGLAAASIIPVVAFKWSITVTLPILCGAFLALDLMLYNVLKTVGVRRFGNIDG
ncbi:MAG TPA: ABC transporter permease [Candidatus Atribacteria bacterium]|nr:ABC transporter permease [Candidatus Atribacteria bacterium]